VFDGNLHSNGGSYGYDPRLNRTVAVSAAVVQEALLKVYDQPQLVKELNGSGSPPPPPGRLGVRNDNRVDAGISDEGRVASGEWRVNYNSHVDKRASGSRSARITVRRFVSAAEADRHDAEYWLSLAPAERLLQVWRLSVELWRFRGEFRDEPGLCRSVASVRRP